MNDAPPPGTSDALPGGVLIPAQRIRRGGQAGCVTGAPSVSEYRDGLARAGSTGIGITAVHQAGDGTHATIIRAARP